MLAKGEDVKKRLQLGDALIEQKDRVDKAILAAQVDYAKLERALIDPTDPERQKGNGLQTSTFVKKLKRLLPNIHWLINPHYEDKCGIFLRKRQIASGEYPFMPEWSILTETYELLPTMSPEHVITKEGYQRELFRPGIPTMRKTPAGVRESQRGWRTILMRLIMDRLITLEATEIEFGAGNRASWATTLKMYQPQTGDLVL